MITAPKIGTTRSCFKWSLVTADLQASGREGRRCKGRNGQVHLAGHRGTDPDIMGRTRRDNVGKGQIPSRDWQQPAKTPPYKVNSRNGRGGTWSGA